MHLLPVSHRTQFHQDVVETIFIAGDSDDLENLRHLASTKRLFYELHENHYFLVLVVKQFMFYQSYHKYADAIWKTALKILREYLRP